MFPLDNIPIPKLLIPPDHLPLNRNLPSTHHIILSRLVILLPTFACRRPASTLELAPRGVGRESVFEKPVSPGDVGI